MANNFEQRLSMESLSNLNDAFAHDPGVEHVNTPLWREIAWPAEWLRLRSDPVFYGINVPRGSSEPVLLVPGFMAGDSLMLEMNRWLRRIGYKSSLAGIVWNTDCPDRTAMQVLQRVRLLHKKTGKKVRLIGHSLGGMIAKAIVQQEPELIDRVITLGSPFKSLVRAHSSVIGIWDTLKVNRSDLVGRNLKPSCATGHCTCGFVRSILQPTNVAPPQFAVYSKLDGVADWESCIEDDPSMNTEICGTHIGMVVNPDVYRVVAQRLSEEIPLTSK